MKQGLSQSARLGQELRINPRLYQAMDMLTMPLLDLQQHLKQELQQNPFLDLVEPDEDDDEDATSDLEVVEKPETPEEKQEPEDENTAWEDLMLDGFEEGSRGLSGQSDAQEYIEPVTVAATGLAEHLREQVTLLELTDRERVLADEFIGNIGEDGYLTCTLEELLAGINETITRHAEDAGIEGPIPVFTMAEAEKMLATMQLLDPAGVAARDVRECLRLQLRDQGRAGSLADRLLDEAFEELIARKWTELARRYDITPTEVQEASDEIARLDPKPGLRYSAREEGFVIPDLVVDKIDGEYRVFTNDSHMPRLRLSRSYEHLARDRRNLDAEQRDFIQTRMNAAHWLVQAIEQRRQTMLKVMNFIVDRQRDFLEKGVEYLKPLTLREVAEVVGLHESTVSRVTSDKYVQTPRGVLPLKFFFSSALSTTGGEDVSARGIRAQIEKLVGNEDPKEPLTDQEIVQILQKDGINIARRTVAKYREQLKVLPARMRKRV
ncbi:MAG TPA: RNA polymerase factor sigma-54 [Gemmatimonadaceae bacterium]|nr:RNA polymerase factor sigma-54 [Gemmatimonadaceae bacterium]